MNNLPTFPDWLTLAMYLIGGPVYIYAILRWWSSGIARSIFEVFKEFQLKQKKEGG